MGQGNQERLDLYAGKVGGQRENALQSGPALNQAAGAGLAFLIALLVLQNLLAVLKLPDFLQDFFALVFFCFAWAVLSLCISLSPLAASSSRA